METDSAVQVFHALSDGTRLAVIERLKDGERCVCELMDLVDASQSRLSFHLKVLKDAGLVDFRRDGRWSHYWLVPEAFSNAVESLKGLAPSRLGRAAAARCCG